MSRKLLLAFWLISALTVVATVVAWLRFNTVQETIGRLTEWMSSVDTPEDRWAARTAQEYGAFLHTVPWYQFPFASRLAALWTETPLWGPHLLRKWERRAVLSAEYLFKAGYGSLMGLASATAYAPEDLQVHAIVRNAPISPTVFISRRQITRSCIDRRISVFSSMSQFSSATMRSPPSTGSVA